MYEVKVRGNVSVYSDVCEVKGEGIFIAYSDVCLKYVLREMLLCTVTFV